MRDQLPPDRKRELDYHALIETLGVLEGEGVCLSILGWSTPAADGKTPRLSVAGRLRNIGHSWADGFAIGDGGRVLLYEPDFAGASVWTFDGNDFFQITMQFGDVTFIIGDVGSVGGDELAM